MFSLFVENEYGERLEITHNSAFTIESIDGFDPPDVRINTTEGAGDDGSVFNSARLENRTVSLTIAINSPALDNRHVLYRYFRPKGLTRLYYRTEAREVYCEGYVQQFPVDMFAKKEVAQISILCPNPFLLGVDDSVTRFSYVEDLFEFPFDIESAGESMSELHTVQEETVVNGGDLETGAVIQLHAIGAVVNPSVLYADTGERISISYSVQAGDDIVIDTRKKHKGVKLTRAGVVTNLIGYVSSDSVFFSLRAGDSAIVVDASSGAANLDVTVTVENHFAGV